MLHILDNNSARCSRYAPDVIYRSIPIEDYEDLMVHVEYLFEAWYMAADCYC